MAVSLLFYMPARVAVQSFGLPVAPSRLSGTIWAGQVQVDADHALRWTVDPWASLWSLAAVADLRLDGTDTALEGRVQAGRRGLRLQAVQGRAGWALVRALLPDVPILCDGTLVIERLDIRLHGQTRSGQGTARTTPATCARRDGVATGVPAPALRAVIDSDDGGLRAVVTAEEDPATPLVTARLTNADRIILTIHAAGAAMVPGMPTSSDSEIELPLSALRP